MQTRTNQQKILSDSINSKIRIGSYLQNYVPTIDNIIIVSFLSMLAIAKVYSHIHIANPKPSVLWIIFY